MRRALIIAVLLLAVLSSVFAERPEPTDISSYATSVPDISDVSPVEKRIYFYRDGLRIYAKLYLPAGDGPFPLLIMQPGFRGRQSLCIAMTGPFLRSGIACLTYDCTGAPLLSKSDGDLLEMTFLTEVMDTFAVLDGVKELPKINAECVYVWGHSTGGLVMSYAAVRRPDDVKGILAVEPSYHMQELFTLYFEGYEEIPQMIQEPLYGSRQFVIDAQNMAPYDLMREYPGSVLIVRGDRTPSIGADYGRYLDTASELFPNARMVTAHGADHSFSGGTQAAMLAECIDFIKNDMK